MIDRIMQYVRSRPASVLTWLLFALCVPVDALAVDRLTTIDGRQLDVQLQSIDENGRITADSLDVPITLDRLVRIERTDAPTITPEGRIVVYLAGGSHLRAQRIVVDLDDEKCVIIGFVSDDVELPLEIVRAVFFQGDDRRIPPPRGLVDALAEPRSDVDMLYVADDSGTHSMEGFLESVDEEYVHFVWEGQSRKISRTAVVGLVLANVAGDEPVAAVDVHLVGGDRILGDVKSLVDGVLTLRVAETAEVAIPLNRVAVIDINTPRLSFLSQLEPVQQIHRPSFAARMPLLVDRSAGGKPLTLRQQQYERGLGMHSYARVIYELPGQFDLFLAIVGIDDATEGRGDCLIYVMADDREVFKTRVRGVDDPIELRLNIEGVRRLTLIVEQGADFDLSDHVDWCDARVVRMSD